MGPEDSEQTPRKANPPLTEKESYKWIEALNETKAQTPEGVEVISICDREADIYEFFVESQDTPFVIRAVQNRIVDDEMGKLNPLVKSQPASGMLVVKVLARGNRAAREATVSVHFTTTTLVPPYRSQALQPQNLPAIDVNVIWVT